MKHYQDTFSIKGLIKSFRNAFRGFRVLLWSEYNLYIQLFAGLILILAGYFFHINSIEWAIQMVIIGLVIFAELVNTAIEKSMDLVHPEYSERVRDIKDLAAASVLFAVIIAVSASLFIYIPKIVLYL